MSLEFYTTIAVAVALAGLILTGHRSLAASIADVRKELREEFREDMGAFRSELSDLRREFNAFGAQVHKEIAALSERVARLEGLVEGLRDAVTGKAA